MNRPGGTPYVEVSERRPSALERLRRRVRSLCFQALRDGWTGDRLATEIGTVFDEEGL